LIAVATSALQDEAEIALNNMAIRDLVHVVISSADVERGKPAPDAYKAAVKKLGLRPHECLVYEDAPKGVAAANAAGISAVRIFNGRNQVPGVFLTIPDFEGHSIPELPTP
jgi:beta-phosphoglucomutase-like phosphatase (HAD superfamily)